MNNQPQIATLKILYAEVPINIGDAFIEIRRWETADGENIETVIEHGQLDEDGDLLTSFEIIPFYSTVRDALEALEYVTH